MKRVELLSGEVIEFESQDQGHVTVDEAGAARAARRHILLLARELVRIGAALEALHPVMRAMVTVASVKELASLEPKAIGQFAVTLDTRAAYVATSLDVGAWMPYTVSA